MKNKLKIGKDYNVKFFVNYLLAGTSLMGTLANSEDPDETPPQRLIFHQGLHNLHWQNNLQGKKSMIKP